MPIDPHEWAGDRTSWIALADLLISAGMDRIPPGQASAVSTEQPSNHGHAADGMEGFARVFLLAAFRIAGTEGNDCQGLIEKLRVSVRAGVSQKESLGAWPEPVDFGHSIVEASSIALALWLTRPWIWDSLQESDKRAVTRWLAAAARAKKSKNNWVIFGAVISAFLLAVGRNEPDSHEILKDSLASIDEWVASDGWYSDGPTNSYDYYNSWSFHFYPPLIAFLSNNEKLLDRYRSRLDIFLETYPLLFSTDGGHVYFGRSLTYRFAASASVSMGALLGCRSVSSSTARNISTANVQHFLRNCDDAGAVLLSRGWFKKNVSLTQAYSGPLASYWAAKAFVNLLIPPESTYWTEQNLIIRQDDLDRDLVTRIKSPNILVARSEHGRLVRVANHGSYNRITTDDQKVVDDKLYSRVGYSNVTAPVSSASSKDSGFYFSTLFGLSGRGRVSPISGGINWASSHSSHRMRNPLSLHPRVGRRLGPFSRAFAPSVAVPNTKVKTLTLIKGSWNIEVLFVDNLSRQLRQANFGGWAVPDTERTVVDTEQERITIDNGLLISRTVNLLGFSKVSGQRSTDSNPFGESCTIGTLSSTFDSRRQQLLLVAATSLALKDSPMPPERNPTVLDVDTSHLTVSWADNVVQRIDYKEMTVVNS
ncbi:DUF2264 domain-containing protein [Pseudarthrobacter scleromae]|uniref:DUF2264 domain-containing protein n=1 Tax=Pseudarthrobacter scleromae TaxID=158897 RepID=UPI003D09049B